MKSTQGIPRAANFGEESADFHKTKHVGGPQKSTYTFHVSYIIHLIRSLLSLAILLLI